MSIHKRFAEMERHGIAASAAETGKASRRMKRDNALIRKLMNRCAWYEGRISELKAPQEGWEQFARKQGYLMRPADPKPGQDEQGVAPESHQ